MPELPAGTVTFLFTDIENSTRLWDRFPEAMRAALARHDALAASACARHGGILLKSRGEGDSLFAVFPGATAAALAASELQQTLCAEPWQQFLPTKHEPSAADFQLRVRMALHTGEADLRDGDYYGSEVNRTARLRGVAHGGQILLSQATSQLLVENMPPGIHLRDLGLHRLRDLQRAERIAQMLHDALPPDFPPLRSLEAFAHNLPIQLTRFIGREHCVTEVTQLLQHSRLLTITGFGGCGKTRLALQVGAEVVETFREGVWLIEMDALTDPLLVPQAIATALRVSEEAGRALLATLADNLRHKALLLILDNCEHIIEGVAQAAEDLLQSCPHLQILATSREALNIAGEQTWQVPTLTLPDTDSMPLETLARSEAMALFLDRARSADAHFYLTPANAPILARICRRLEGIPLAIELAAARVDVLSLEQLAQDDRLRVLKGGARTAPERQRTLRAAIDWSYARLSEPERVLLRRLSVFKGGWTLEAAEAVCGGEDGGEVLETLIALVNKSLVLADETTGGIRRYRMLETIRQYSEEKLAETGETETIGEKHRDWYRAFAEGTEPKLRGAEQAQWLERLAADSDNLRAALRWSVDGDARLGLAGALGWFWYVRGQWSEGRGWLEGALARPGGSDLARAKALDNSGVIAWAQGDYAAAKTHHENSLTLRRKWNDPRGVAASLNNLALVARDQGDDGLQRRLLEQSLTIYRELDDRRGIAITLGNLGALAVEQQDFVRARERLEESLALQRELNNAWYVAMNLLNLGEVACKQEDYTAATTFLRDSLTTSQELGDLSGIAFAFASLGNLANHQGNYERAACLLAIAETVQEQVGVPFPPHNQESFEANIARARQNAGDAAFEVAWGRGKTLSMEDGAAFALETPNA